MILGGVLLVLVALLLLGVLFLYHDAGARRIQGQLAIAIPTRAAPVNETIRLIPRMRLRDSSFDRLLKLVFNYEADAPRFWPVSYIVLVSIGVAIVGMIVGRLVSPLWLVLIEGIVVGCISARNLFAWQHRRYADRLVRQLPDTIELVVSAVRAGLPITEAFHAVVRRMPEPTKQQFDLIIKELALGRTPEEGLQAVYTRTRVDEYAMFAVTLAVQRTSGGGLAETLQTLGDTIRQRVALAGRAKALAGEAKLSARVLAALPFLAATLMYFERPDALNPLFYDPRGRLLMAIGLTSLTLGILTMRYMIRKGTTV